MSFGFFGFWEIPILLSAFILPLWAAVTVAQKDGLTSLIRVLLIGIAVLAPIVGPIAVLILTPTLPGRTEAR